MAKRTPSKAKSKSKSKSGSKSNKAKVKRRQNKREFGELKKLSFDVIPVVAAIII